MLVKESIGYLTECDLCGARKSTHDGIVARGATGRYCVVMSCCKVCAEKSGLVAIDRDAAMARIAEDPHGFADF